MRNQRKILLFILTLVLTTMLDATTNKHQLSHGDDPSARTATEWNQSNEFVITNSGIGCNLPYTDPNKSLNKGSLNWSSGAIDISCASSVKISMDIEGLTEETLESNDYLNIYYKVDGGARQTISENTDGFVKKTAFAKGIKGNSVELIIEGLNSASDEIYNVTSILIEEFIVSDVPQTVIITPEGSDQTTQIRNALINLNKGDKIVLDGDFIISGTLLLPSDITWELKGTMTLAPMSFENGSLQRVTYNADSRHGNGRYTVIGAVQPAENIEMYGGVYEGDGDNNNTERLRFIQMMDVTNCHFHDMEVNNVSDDCFTLGNGATYNKVERVIGRDAGGKITKDGGNAMTDNGSYNTWEDCRAIDGGSDGWTPKCQNSTFIRCTAENNMGPGWGFYARLDGVAFDEGIEIKGNKLIDCVGFGSKHSSGVSFDISSNCPGGEVFDNYISGRYYDNQSAGVEFRNKDNANLGVIRDNEVDIHCWGNKALTSSGNNHSWAGGLGAENDRDHEITNIFGSVVCYDNVNRDVNLKGAKNCNIKVYRPNAENAPVLDMGSSNTVTVTNFDCGGSFSTWCQQDYCNQINVGVADREIQSSSSLSQIYPNPVNHSSTIEFTIKKNEFVSLKIYDLSGKELKTLVDGHKLEGKHKSEFSRANMPSGTYFYKLQVGSSVETNKIILK